MSRGRRAGLPRTARGTEDPAILDLLDAVREVRTTLAIDLSATAGALDADHPEVALDFLDAASAELQALATRARRPMADESAARRRARRTRAMLALPAIPLVGAIAMTTAAAMTGSSAQPATHHTVATATAPAHSSATTTLRRLEHVVTQHPQAAQVIAVANDLHKQLTQMIATSTGNPGQLHVVRQLLTLEQHVLESSKVPGTQLALAASRAITEMLDHRPAHAQPRHSSTPHTTPTSAPSMRPPPKTAPTQTRAQRAPQQHQSGTTKHASPSPQPTNPLLGSGLFNGS